MAASLCASMRYVQVTLSRFLSVTDYYLLQDRVDVLKALIIGPADTPYENGAQLLAWASFSLLLTRPTPGCFLFDIHLPARCHA